MGVELYLVAALSANRGIGLKGALPWKLPGDMNFFKKLTSEVPKPELRNAVIVGRKTWDSIPLRFRPLKGRLNIIISRTLHMEDSPEVHVSGSLDDALSFISKDPSIHRVYVIGGSTIYEQCLDREECKRLYLTEIHKEFECDVFFPAFDPKIYTPIKVPELDCSLQKEGDVEYEFVCYQKS